MAKAKKETKKQNSNCYLLTNNILGIVGLFLRLIYNGIIAVAGICVFANTEELTVPNVQMVTKIFLRDSIIGLIVFTTYIIVNHFLIKKNNKKINIALSIVGCLLVICCLAKVIYIYN